MENEIKEYLRKLINNVDSLGCEINEIISDDYLQDDEMYYPIYDAIGVLQEAITEYQENNNYI